MKTNSSFERTFRDVSFLAHTHLAGGTPLNSVRWAQSGHMQIKTQTDGDRHGKRSTFGAAIT